MYFAVFKKRKFFALAIAVIVLLISIAVLPSTSLLQASASNKKLPIYRVRTDKKVLSISFDCAWGVDYTDKLLSVMQEEGVRCTFFTVEFWARKHPDYLKKISSFGHEIGTHSATHPYMSKLDKDGVNNELKTSINAIESVTGKKVELFRPPYGDYNDNLIETAKEAGLFTIQWDVDSLDWKNLSAKEIKNRVVSRVKSGSIVLFHNQGLHTAEALPEIIRELKNQGYQFVPISELIYKENYQIAHDGEQYLNS